MSAVGMPGTPLPRPPQPRVSSRPWLSFRPVAQPMLREASVLWQNFDSDGADDRACESRALSRQIRITKAYADSSGYMSKCRCCVVALVGVSFLRLLVWSSCHLPEGVGAPSTTYEVQMISTLVGALTSAIALPLAIGGKQGCCVRQKVLGPLTTLGLAAVLTDFCALVVVLSCRQPPAAGAATRAWLTEAWLRSLVDVWECTLISSFCLNLAFVVSCWRVYQELRLAGLYPLETNERDVETISHLELCFEAEDVHTTEECSRLCGKDDNERGADLGCCSSRPAVEATVPLKWSARQREGEIREAATGAIRVDVELSELEWEEQLEGSTPGKPFCHLVSALHERSGHVVVSSDASQRHVRDPISKAASSMR